MKNKTLLIGICTFLLTTSSAYVIAGPGGGKGGGGGHMGHKKEEKAAHVKEHERNPMAATPAVPNLQGEPATPAIPGNPKAKVMENRDR